ncbi:hypothetical protein [Kitasatospora cathayae]|uniref:Apea-like HEPN domain-containing protein n=1 Tax=Kitasatospora cathayae TaxID=3004092 RepID=A0ABY7Q6G2_9ACTN|nr:hypothetical protein [Kitasatospora sp. HUAS 3-15]WBP88181.1 hypothetical protein O1G21_21670 [Kitasatospora sp. HUAS 3-15]
MSLTVERALEILEIPFGPLVDDGDWISLARPIVMRDDKLLDRFPRGEVVGAVDQANAASSNDGIFLSWGNKCEVMVSEHGNQSSYASGIWRDGLALESGGENPQKYSLGAPSLSYFLHFMNELPNAGVPLRRHPVSIAVRDRARVRMRHNSGAARLSGDAWPPAGLTQASAEEAAQKAFPGLTLRIESPRSRNDFEALANSFLFNLAYNHDYSFLVASSVDGIARGGRIARVRRASEDQIDAPRMTYQPDLVHHYQLGVSTESPSLAYLSFYHIAEHFYEKVYSEDLVDQVRAKIADPSFSLKRSGDVQAVIKIISNSQKKVRDEGGVDEQKSLQLVLRKYVDLARLSADLDSYAAGLVAHYKADQVSFADANATDLRGERSDEVFSSLAKRIYRTRNALVHAKDGVRPKYRPFTNDAELSGEVPLMRFCAEQIIIATGRVI